MKNTGEKLTYIEYNGCKDILKIDLHNGYTIIAIKSWNTTEKRYYVELRLKENTVEKWNLIQSKEGLILDVDYKTINKAILKCVATLLSEGFFDAYIREYEYELKCFDMGNEIIELYKNDEIIRSLIE